MFMTALAQLQSSFPEFKKTRFIALKVCTACSRTNYKIVSFTKLNKYLHYGTSETEVNININATNGSGKFLKKK
jgi:hypothetical protein